MAFNVVRLTPIGQRCPAAVVACVQGYSGIYEVLNPLEMWNHGSRKRGVQFISAKLICCEDI